MDYVHDYIIAETEEERIAIGMTKINALWRSTHNDNSMPDARFCALYIKPFTTKESFTRALGALNLIRNKVLAGTAHEWTVDVNTAVSEIDRILKLERL
jgi:hypothetical protein